MLRCVCICLCLTSISLADSPDSLLLLVSLDGFRHDYLHMAKAAHKTLPHFDRFLQTGVNAKAKPIFPALSLPNHMTLMTGLYAEHHGIVANYFFDPTFPAYFDMSDPTNVYDSRWFAGTKDGLTVEPLWVTNERFNYVSTGSTSRRSGVYRWPTCKAPYQRNVPIDFIAEDKQTASQRMKIVTDWFIRKEKPVNFVMLHLSDLTEIAEKHSPNSTQILDALADIDEALGVLFNATDSHDKLRRLNIVMVGSHGVTTLPANHHIGIMQYVDLTDFSLYFDIYGKTPIFSINPQSGKEINVYETFSQIPHTILYRKSELPYKYRYRDNDRVMPFTLLVQPGWSLEQSVRNDNITYGQVSYDADLDDMQTVLFAMGPAFKTNHTANKVNIIDVYSLLCHLLQVEANRHDGNIHNIKHLLNHESQLLIPQSHESVMIVLTAVICSLLLFGCFVNFILALI